MLVLKMDVKRNWYKYQSYQMMERNYYHSLKLANAHEQNCDSEQTGSCIERENKQERFPHWNGHSEWVQCNNQRNRISVKVQNPSAVQVMVNSTGTVSKQLTWQQRKALYTFSSNISNWHIPHFVKSYST